MNIKTFTAAKMSEALARVKRELGPGAVILHTRAYRRGGVFGLGARPLVEVTAADGRHIRLPRRRQSPSRLDRGGGQVRSTLEGHANAEEKAGDLIRRTYAAARSQLQQEAVCGQVGGTPVDPQGTGGLAEEMRSVKRMVARMAQQQKSISGQGSVAPGLPNQLFDQYLNLLEQEVSEELAQQVIEQVRTEMTGRDLDDEVALREVLIGAVAELIPTDENAGEIDRPKDGRPYTVALIGPTGVGKTTTVAKLAANFKLKQKLEVSLITLDTYRIAAVDQLQTYANIIGVRLYVVSSPEQMIDAMQRCRDTAVTLIDTAGRSQRDDPKLEQLASSIQSARPHEVHLVLSSTCAERVLLETIERFNRIPTDRIIFTKLDEAVGFGVLLNEACKVNKRLSFVTTGQEVPHQIEPSRPGRLAALVLGCDSVKPSDPLVSSAVRERSVQAC